MNLQDELLCLKRKRWVTRKVFLTFVISLPLYKSATKYLLHLVVLSALKQDISYSLKLLFSKARHLLVPCLRDSQLCRITSRQPLIRSNTNEIYYNFIAYHYYFAGKRL